MVFWCVWLIWLVLWFVLFDSAVSVVLDVVMLL